VTVAHKRIMPQSIPCSNTVTVKSPFQTKTQNTSLAQDGAQSLRSFVDQIQITQNIATYAMKSG
ncbi:MAG: hypothetical protein WA699_15015, partial [Pseudolabrys sp.]